MLLSRIMQFFKDKKEYGRDSHKWWHFIYLRSSRRVSDMTDSYISQKTTIKLTFCKKCGFEKRLTTSFMSDIK